MLDTDVGFDGSRVATATVPLSASRESIRSPRRWSISSPGDPASRRLGVINDLPRAALAASR
ncbi:MAG: hypothetical protein R2882_13980 [Gemmatimonadales bacterium]